MDLWQMDVRRFGAQYRSPSYTLKRVLETYETYYDIHYPFEERQAGRPLRVSPAYDWHREHDAAFGEKSGWERVNWYELERGAGRRVAAAARLGGQALVAGDRRRARAPAARRPRSSTSRRSPSSRWRARAPRSCSSGCATTEVAREVGRVTYTQMLNSRGGIECDFTVARLGEELFSIVTGTAFGNHDREWIRRHLPDDGSAAGARRDARLGLLRDLGTALPRRARPAHARNRLRTTSFPT